MGCDEMKSNTAISFFFFYDKNSVEGMEKKQLLESIQDLKEICAK